MYRGKGAEKQTVPEAEIVEQPNPQIPPRPIMPLEATAFLGLQKVKVTLDKHNHLIFEAERERSKLEIELSNLIGLARLTKKKELENRISGIKGRDDRPCHPNSPYI